MSGLKKNSRTGKTTPIENVKFVSYEEIKRLSDENIGMYNRNIDYQELEKRYNGLDKSDYELIRIMDHNHFRGKTTQKHYRCLIRHPKIKESLIQDVSTHQWDSL